MISLREELSRWPVIWHIDLQPGGLLKNMAFPLPPKLKDDAERYM